MGEPSILSRTLRNEPIPAGTLSLTDRLDAFTATLGEMVCSDDSVPDGPPLTEKTAVPDVMSEDPVMTAVALVPVVPVAPLGPVGPVAPVDPLDPDAPVAPDTPVGPVGPEFPDAPGSPAAPGAPVAPVAPAGSWPLPKSVARRLPFLTFELSMAFFLICFVPTLFLGSFTAA